MALSYGTGVYGLTTQLNAQLADGTIAEAADLALKANIASPTFTGIPAAPTAVTNTATTQLATTAFVQGATRSKSQVSALATVATADATDLATALVLVNALKVSVNAIIAALKA